MAVTIPGYENFRPIGSGGFSTVYEARQPELNRRVAVKVLTIGAGQDFDRAAFEGECRAMGTVSEHPSIVTVYESGFTGEGLPYITMELYHETLLDKIKARRFLPLDEVLAVGVQMASALHRSHEERLLHRDIKPQNIFFSQYGEPFLGDFGIAALAHEQHAQRSFGLTFHYAAPEVIDGEMPVVESDIYSLGATLYTAIAGHRPFARPGARETEDVVANRILSEPPPKITAQPIPDNVERSLLSLLAKHPNDRPRTALEVGKRLRELQERLGQPLTPMRVATTDFDDEHTVARNKPDRSEHSVEAAPETIAPGPPVVPDDTFEDSLSGSVTVYKATNRDRRTGDNAPAPTSRRPILAGAAVAAVLLVAVVAGFVVLGGDDEPTLTTTDPEPTTSNNPTVVVANPPDRVEEVEFTTTEDGTVTASWQPAERATQYRVTFTAGGLDFDLVDGPQIVIDIAQADGPVCIEVEAATEDGQTARASEPACYAG